MPGTCLARAWHVPGTCVAPAWHLKMLRMLLETLARDAALAARLLRRNPTYALTALLTLALGLATRRRSSP